MIKPANFYDYMAIARLRSLRLAGQKMDCCLFLSCVGSKKTMQSL